MKPEWEPRASCNTTGAPKELERPEQVGEETAGNAMSLAITMSPFCALSRPLRERKGDCYGLVMRTRSETPFSTSTAAPASLGASEGKRGCSRRDVHDIAAAR